MTIADKLTRLSTAHDAIISAINAKGGSATGDGFEDFAADIAAIPSGSSAWTKIATQEFNASTNSSSAIIVGTIDIGSSNYTSNFILYVKVRDKAGAQASKFVGCDCLLFNVQAANSQTSNATSWTVTTFSKGTSAFVMNCYASSAAYGVYAGQLSSAGVLTIYARYNNSGSRTINGTYEVTVWKLDYAPDQGNPFDYSYA